MRVIRLTESEIQGIIKNAVRKVLREGADEVRGVSMADKEDVIRELVEYITGVWSNVEERNQYLIDTGTFSVRTLSGDAGKVDTYKFSVPLSITEKLGLAKNLEMNVVIQNYIYTNKEVDKFLGVGERTTKGVSWNREEDRKFDKTTMRMKSGLIELTVPAFNGELQVQGLYSTLYHELNHSFTDQEINKKGFYGQSTIEMQRPTRKVNTHNTVQQALNPPPPFGQIAQQIRYGQDTETFRAVNFLFYSLWETTERNARAESLYGDLQAMNSKRENFEEDYKKTTVCNEIDLMRNTLLKMAEELSPDSKVWYHVGEVIGEKTNGRARKRFINRTKELIDQLEKKAMRVAKLYYDRHEEQKSPGM